MAVTSPASLSKIIAEFGGPSNLKAYNRGGTYVPNVAANNAVSTDPNLLTISSFVGAVATVSPVVAMPNDQGYSQGNQGVIQCTLHLYADGTYMVDTNMSDPVNPYMTAGVASDVDVYVTANGPTNGSGQNIWLNLGTAKSWGISTGVNGGIARTLNLTFRNKNTFAQLDTAIVNLEVWRGVPL